MSASHEIQLLILTIRGQKVIIDADLAKIYAVTTKALNQAIRRNHARFPADFIFQLTMKEKQEVVTNCDHLAKLKFSRTCPTAATPPRNRVSCLIQQQGCLCHGFRGVAPEMMIITKWNLGNPDARHCREYHDSCRLFLTRFFYREPVGTLAMIYGTFILLLCLIPNPIGGRIAFNVCGLAMMGVGRLLRVSYEKAARENR
jgi:hypothetical protein